MSKTIRLNKVLRELNISIDRVAEFLSSKGHSIEKRPTTKISQELYDLLCDEFHIDADKKIASQEAVEAKNKEKQELREKQENLILGSKKESEVIRASSKLVQFKKLGKIDLEKKSSELSTPKIDEENSLDKPDIVSAKKDNYKTLSGLKSTGETIDLDKFKKNDESKVEPKSKRKRKRILSKGIENSSKGIISSKNKIKDKSKNIVKEEPSEEEVQQQIKETLEKLQNKKILKLTW